MRLVDINLFLSRRFERLGMGHEVQIQFINFKKIFRVKILFTLEMISHSFFSLNFSLGDMFHRLCRGERSSSL